MLQKVKEGAPLVWFEILPKRHGIEDAFSFFRRKALQAPNAPANTLTPLGREFLPALVELPDPGPFFGCQFPQKLPAPE